MHNTESLFNYSHISKKSGFYNLSKNSQILIYGKDVYSLLNKYSIRNIYKINEKAFYSILMNKKNLLGEVLIIKISPYRFIICSDKENYINKIYKIFNFNKRKFPYLTIEKTNNFLCLFSLHGKLTDQIIASKTDLYQYVKVNRQNYYYYILYTIKNKENKILEYLKLNGCKEINVDNYLLFLYNNRVITNIDKINNKFKYNIIKNLYGADNYNFKCKPKIITIKLFESTKDISLYKNMKIYNNNHKKIGYVHRSFHNPNKKNPFILSIVYKFRAGKLALIKDIKTKNDVLIKQRNIYN